MKQKSLQPDKAANSGSAIDLLREELISVGVEAADWQEVLTLLANRLFQAGYVRESYLQAVLDRERQFPTGLRTAEVAVALPHTEKEHVLKPAVAVAILAHPLPSVKWAQRIKRCQ